MMGVLPLAAASWGLGFGSGLSPPQGLFLAFTSLLVGGFLMYHLALIKANTTTYEVRGERAAALPARLSARRESSVMDGQAAPVSPAIPPDPTRTGLIRSDPLWSHPTWAHPN